MLRGIRPSYSRDQVKLQIDDYRDVTPLAWGERFHDRGFVSRPAMRLIAEQGDMLKLPASSSYDRSSKLEA